MKPMTRSAYMDSVSWYRQLPARRAMSYRNFFEVPSSEEEIARWDLEVEAALARLDEAWELHGVEDPERLCKLCGNREPLYGSCDCELEPTHCEDCTLKLPKRGECGCRSGRWH